MDPYNAEGKPTVVQIPYMFISNLLMLNTRTFKNIAEFFTYSEHN